MSLNHALQDQDQKYRGSMDMVKKIVRYIHVIIDISLHIITKGAIHIAVIHVESEEGL